MSLISKRIHETCAPTKFLRLRSVGSASLYEYAVTDTIGSKRKKYRAYRATEARIQDLIEQSMWSQLESEAKFALLYLLYTSSNPTEFKLGEIVAISQEVQEWALKQFIERNASAREHTQIEMGL